VSPTPLDRRAAHRLLSGAYGDQSGLVSELRSLETLTLWGREDEVIPPAGLSSAWPAGQLVEALPSTTFRWVERSGHTPHLEQPQVSAAAIAAFVGGEPVVGDSDTSGVQTAARTWATVTAFVEQLTEKLGAAARERVGALREAASQDGKK
jgi:hypothetical protein